MQEVLDFLIYALLVSIILYSAYRAWKRAEIQEKFAKANEVEADFKNVTKFEEDFKDFPEKVSKVQQFKNKNL